jgi:CRISPR-associated protein Cas2
VSRRRYLVAYDIREPKRLKRTHAAMKGFGYPLQYSVFICDLSLSEKIMMREAVGEIMNQAVDSFAIVDLGDPEIRGVECFEFIGRMRPLPRGEARVV